MSAVVTLSKRYVGKIHCNDILSTSENQGKSEAQKTYEPLQKCTEL